MKGRNDTLKKIATSHFLLVMILLSQFVMAGIIQGFNVDLPIAVSIVLSQLTIIMPFTIYCIVKKENPFRMIRLKKIKFKTALLAVAIAVFSYPVVVLLNMVSMIFVENAMIKVMPDVLAMGLIPGLLLMAFLPAMVEETIFRGMVYNTYSKRRPIIGILLSALLFGLMHMNFNQLPYAMYLGIIMALVMEACDSILAPMIVHFTMNATSSTLAFLTKDALEETAGASNDFKSIIMESYQASSEQMGVTMSPEQLEEMLPVLMAGMIVVYAVLALIALGIVFTLIYAVFRSNGRLPKQVFQVDHSDTAYVLKKDGSKKKNRMVDIWLLIFIGYTLYECLVSAGVL